MEYFPYEPRSTQRDIVSFIDRTVSSGRHAVIESGTGTGKTICSLAGTLPFAKREGKKILYLTRTKSQQKQIITELRTISKDNDVFGIAMQGRSASTCPMMAGDPELRYGTSEELSKLCSHLKKRGADGRPKCPYFAAIADLDPEEYVRTVKEDMPDPETFQRRCSDDGYCPYEASKLCLPYADVVAVPYTFAVIPAIRKHLLDWLNVPLEDLMIIVDEAHNLPDFLRDSCTSEYFLHSLEYVEKEADDQSDPEVAEGISVTDVVAAMRKCFSEAALEYLMDADGLIPYGFMEEILMGELCVPSTHIQVMCKNMIELGETIKEQKKERRKLPRSYIGNLGAFIDFWMRCDDIGYVRLINGGTDPSFEAYCMDPYEAALPFRECFSSIHMSGTLEPLEQYVQELGLIKCDHCVFPSPFDPENLITLYAEDVTTRHKDLQIDPDNIDRIKDYIIDIVNGCGRNTAVFFPSYEMMDRFFTNGTAGALEAQVFSERRGMSQVELMETVDNFRSSSGGVLFAVTGGRISEGVDFPDRDLEVAVIVGLPYPRPSFKKEALIRYYDRRFGNGWECVVKTPMVRKMRQARGRLIRSENDRGAAVILDSRVTQIYGFGSIPSKDPVADISDFFDGLIAPTELGLRRGSVQESPDDKVR